MNNMDHFDNFSGQAREILMLAQNEAEKRKSRSILTEHLLLALLNHPKSVSANILGSFGITSERVQLSAILNKTKENNRGLNKKLELSSKMQKVLTNAVNFASQYKHNMVGTEHLLLGLVSEQNNNACKILCEFKVSPKIIKKQILTLFDRVRIETSDISGLGDLVKRFLGEAAPVGFGGEKTKKDTSALNYFCTDLTKKARENKLDPVVGREKEIERLVSILNRRSKNNPVLIGEAGVGKTAIVEGLAQKITKGLVPGLLLDKRILTLDLALVIAGSKYRGEFEERIKQILEEIKKAQNIILFIDEMHSVIGAGSAEGALDAANILKPALARGELHCIGATTIDEYRKHIEKDSALERRFQQIKIDEPTLEETIKILRGLRKNYEEHHKLKITDEALESAARLSDRYITERFLPDKAVDLLDEAASYKVIQISGNAVDIMKLKKGLIKLSKKKDKAISKQDYIKAASLKEEELRIKQEIEKLKTSKIKKSSKEIKIDKEDIAIAVSKTVGIPVTRLMASEKKQLLDLEKSLGKTIIGQDEAIKEIAASIRRSRSGISDPNRPIGSFIFLGPTGVGKTELAKVLAETVFESKDALIKLDMSEYSEKHTKSRFLGAPAGYVGFEEGGQLTEMVRRKPYSVVLFDEIEKADPDVLNILLQVMEDGYLNDAQGHKIDFRNTIIIMTSNVGIELLNKEANIGFKSDDQSDIEKELGYSHNEMKQKVLNNLKEIFKPEFLNRVDRTIVFKALDQKSVSRIVTLQFKELQKRLQDQKIKIKFNPETKKFIIKKGFDPEFGARPIRRAIQNEIEDKLSEELLKGRVKIGKDIKVGVVKKKVKFGN